MRDVCVLLFEHFFGKGVANVLIEEAGGYQQAKNYVKFLGAVHGIDKVIPALQTKRYFCASDDLDELLLEKLEREGFVGVSRLNWQFSRQTTSRTKFSRDT